MFKSWLNLLKTLLTWCVLQSGLLSPGAFQKHRAWPPSESCACEWPDILCLYTYTSVLAIKSTSSTSVGLHGWSFTNSFMLYLCSFLQLRNFSNINLIFLLFLYFRWKCNILTFCLRDCVNVLVDVFITQCLTRTFSFSAISLPSLYQPFVFPSYFSASAFSFFCFFPPILTGQEDYRSRLNGECFQDLVCPEKCRCEGTVVDCSNLKLTRVPAHIPEHTTDLWVSCFLFQTCTINASNETPGLKKAYKM